MRPPTKGPEGHARSGVNTKRGDVNPEHFEDKYEDALKELIEKLRKPRHAQTPSNLWMRCERA
jgi:non-homologous end joining protein Ku